MKAKIQNQYLSCVHNFVINILGLIQVEKIQFVYKIPFEDCLPFL